LPQDSASSARVDGQNENPFALVAGSHIGCGKMTPLRIEPERGKISEYAIKSSSRSEAWHILKEYEHRLDFADDSGDGRPDPAFILDAELFSGGAPRLARKSRSDAVHGSTPLVCVELFKISAPNRRWLQARLRHPGQEKGFNEGFPFDVTHNPRVGNSAANSFIEHACPGAKAEHKETGISHTRDSLLGTSRQPGAGRRPIHFGLRCNSSFERLVFAEISDGHSEWIDRD
jgi:hypothetical protein